MTVDPPPAAPHSAARRLRAARDTGSSSLELAIVTPVLFLLIGTVVQVGLWQHAQAIALAAAQEGARAARVPAASQPIADEAGRRRAAAYLDQLASDVLVGGSVRITPERGAANASAAAQGGVTDLVSIRVQGEVLSLVPGLTLTVDEVSTVAVERFRPDTEPAP